MFGGAVADDYPGHLQTDTLGGVYFTGRFNNWNSSVQLSSDTTLTTQSGRSMFLIKYDTAGNYKWVVRPQSDTTGIADNSSSWGLQVDGGGSLHWLTHLLPNYYGNGTFQVSTYSLNILKYNKNGVFQGGIPMDIVSNTFPPYYDNLFFTRNNKSGKIYISGYVNSATASTMSFGSTSITNSVFLGAFSPTGTSLWTKQNTIAPAVGGNTGISDIKIDDFGNIFGVATSIKGDSFAGGAAFVNPLTTSNVRVVAPFKLDSNGNLLWMKNSYNKYNTLLETYGAFNGTDYVVASGHAGPLKWLGLADTLTSTTADWYFFTTRLSGATGQPLSIEALANTGSGTNKPDFAQADKKGNVYFGGQMDRGVVIAGASLNAAGSTSTDFFLAKYGFANCNCIVPTASIAQTSYDNATRSVNFQYTGTTTGIDSIVFTWGNGQRLRLTGNYNGVITRYYGTDTGTYNVCVTAFTNGCGNNTACTVVRFTPLGVGQLNGGSGATMALAPNPATNAVQVSYSLLGTAGSLEVYDLAGRLLSTKALRQKAGTETVTLTDFAAGVYVVVLREEGRVMQQQRLVISK